MQSIEKILTFGDLMPVIVPINQAASSMGAEIVDGGQRGVELIARLLQNPNVWHSKGPSVVVADASAISDEARFEKGYDFFEIISNAYFANANVQVVIIGNKFDGFYKRFEELPLTPLCISAMEPSLDRIVEDTIRFSGIVSGFNSFNSVGFIGPFSREEFDLIGREILSRGYSPEYITLKSDSAPSLDIVASASKRAEHRKDIVDLDLAIYRVDDLESDPMKIIKALADNGMYLYRQEIAFTDGKDIVFGPEQLLRSSLDRCTEKHKVGLEEDYVGSMLKLSIMKKVSVFGCAPHPATGAKAYVLYGMSFSGKSTIISMLEEAIPEFGQLFERVTIDSTREKRPNEDKEILTDEEFQKRLDSGRYIGSYSYAKHRSGIPSDAVNRFFGGKSLIIDQASPQGADACMLGFDVSNGIPVHVLSIVSYFNELKHYVRKGALERKMGNPQEFYDRFVGNFIPTLRYPLHENMKIIDPEIKKRPCLMTDFSCVSEVDHYIKGYPCMALGAKEVINLIRNSKAHQVVDIIRHNLKIRDMVKGAGLSYVTRHRAVPLPEQIE